MKKLTAAEIAIFADCLGFTPEDAAAITEIFHREKLAGNWRFSHRDLDSVDSYIELWGDHWSRYSSWTSLVQSEADQGPDGYSEWALYKYIGKAVFMLPSGMYILGCL